MSLSFVYSLNEHTTKEEIFKKCDDMYNHSPDLTIKLMVFILDKDYGKNLKYSFCYCFLWLYINHRESFYKNLSHIVGVYNTKTINFDEIANLMNKSKKLHDEDLDSLISKEYQKTFIENWESQSKKIFFSEMNIPEYSNWNILLILFDKIQEHYKLSTNKAKKNKLYYVIINLIITQLNKDKITIEQEGYISSCIDIIKENHFIIDYIKNNFDSKQILVLKHYMLRKKSFLDKHKKHAFDLRYKFLKIRF